MYLLNISDYESIKNIINCYQAEFTFALSVIEGKQEGRIYVDNLKDIQSCLIVHSGGKYFVAGNEDDLEFRASLTDFLKDKRNHTNYYDLYTSSPKWIEVLSKELEGNVVKLGRTIYQYNKSTGNLLLNESENLTHGFILKSMNEDLYHKYTTEIDTSYNSLYSSASHFREEGFGYCILRNDEFVSVCNTFHVSNTYAEIDIMTMEEYRGKGFACITASAFISHSLKCKLIPVWDADAGNEPSNKLALKLGFEKVRDTNILWWHENKQVIENYLKKYNYSVSQL